MKVILSYIAILFLTSSSQSAIKVSPKPDILDMSVTMTVHAAETLESVIFRLDSFTGQRIEFSNKALQGYRAKAADYQNIPLRQILKEQLAGTDFNFHVDKKRIWLIKGKTSNQ